MSYEEPDHQIKLLPSDKPWRRGLHKFSKESLKELKDYVKNYKPLDVVPVNQARILIVGQIGAGKSSFFNTINSIYRGHVTAQAASGTDPASLTTKFRTYEVRSDRTGQPMNFRLCDTMGLEADDQGLDITDIHYILDGAVSDSFQFQIGKRLEESIASYKVAELKDRIHVLLIVMDATTTDYFPETIVGKLRSIYNHARKRAIPALVVLSKIDKVCNEVTDDATKVYHSSAIWDCVTKAAEIVRIPVAQVVPMKNYDSETELDQAVDILALFAMRQLLRLADSYFDEQMAIRGISLPQKGKPMAVGTADHGGSGDLPPGWDQRKDEDGVSYYLNRNTGETSHVRPGITTQREVSYHSSESTGRKMEELPSGWEQLTDQSGRPFYLNVKSGSTTKERPIPDKPRAIADAPQLPAGWEEMTDQRGCPFYLNKNTGTTTTKRPSMKESSWTALKTRSGEEYYLNTETGQVTKQKPAVASAESGAEMQTQTGLPPGWQVLRDQDGKEMYLETKTGNTSRTKPAVQLSGANSVLPPGWQMFRDQDGKELYLETKTGHTSRIKPTIQSVLPQGWQMLTDQDGNALYLDTKTGKTTKSIPTIQPTEGKPVEAAIPTGWQVLKDEHGNPLYLDTNTGVTTRDKPTMQPLDQTYQRQAQIPLHTQLATQLQLQPSQIQPIQAQPSQMQPGVGLEPSPLAAGWRMQNDPSRGVPYYVNEASGESRWDRPTDVMAAPAVGSMGMQAEQKQLLPEGWEVVRPAGGTKEYYHNRKSGESCWEKPTS